MDDLDQDYEKTVAQAQFKVQEAGAIREMCQTAGFQIWRKELEAKMGDLKSKWFTASPEESEKIKIRAQVYNEMLDILKSKMLTGDAAAKKLHELQDAQQRQI